ncbi:MAG: hypothetical protein JW759_01670 [Candidatus Coatesbacteria bacterium]|nr:hypothetical protein [Candidatus Coatesbacteria bacterium]
MSALLCIIGTVCLAVCTKVVLGGYWLAQDVPRLQIVSRYIPIILIHASVLIAALCSLGLRRRITSAAKMLCSIAAVTFLLFASPLITAVSRLWEALGGVLFLAFIIAVVVVMFIALWRNLSDLSSRRAVAALVILCASSYFWLGLWLSDQHPPDGDEPYYLLIAHSIAHDLDIDPTNNFKSKEYLSYYPYELQPQYRNISIKGREYAVPNHNIGFPLLIALPYRLFGARGAFALMNLLAALLAANVFLMSQELGASRRNALLGALIFGFLVPMVSYANQLFPAMCAALLVVYAFRRLLRCAPGNWRNLVAILATCFLLFMLKIRLSLIIAPVLLLAAWSTTRRRLIWLYAGGGAALVGVVAWLLRDRFVTLQLLTSRLDELWRMGLSDFTPFNGIFGQMLDQQFGLLVLAPVYILAFIGAASLLKKDRSVLLKMLFVAGPYYVMVSAMPWWNASWCPPCRFLIPILPLMGALIGLGLGRISRVAQAAVFYFAAAVSASFTFLHLLSPVFRYDQPNGANRLFWLLHINTYIDFARLLPSFFRTDITTPVKVLLELLVFALLFVVLLRGRRASGSSEDALPRLKHVFAAGLGVAMMVGMLACAAVCDLSIVKSTYELEDEPLSIWDPPSRAYIRGGRRLTPGYPFERDVDIPGGEKLIIVQAMMRNPIWTTVPNIWLELENEVEKLRVIDEPVDLEVMIKYYKRVTLSGGHYRLRLGIEIPGEDMKEIDPDQVANVYVDRIQIIDPDGLEAFLYKVFSYAYRPFSRATSLEYAGHGYVFQPEYRRLGQRLLSAYIGQKMWSEAAELFSYRAETDPLDLSRETPDVLVKLARAALLMGRGDVALKIAAMVPGSTRMTYEAGLIAAEAHLGRDETEQALARLGSLSGLPHDRDEAIKAEYLSALCVERQGESLRAFEAFRRAANAPSDVQFEALCHVLHLAEKLGFPDYRARAADKMVELKTEKLTLGDMRKSGGQPADGGWVLERNGTFEAPVNVLSDTLAIGMRVKAKGTFETHIETGLVIDPATGLTRYVFPNIKVTLGDKPPKYLSVPFQEWTNTFVFIEGVEEGQHRLSIEYINDHTFQKDRQNRQFFLESVSLQSAVVAFGEQMTWEILPDDRSAVLAFDLAPRFPVRSFAMNVGPLASSIPADAKLVVDGVSVRQFALDQDCGGMIEFPMELAAGEHEAVVEVSLGEGSVSVDDLISAIDIIGFKY